MDPVLVRSLQGSQKISPVCKKKNFARCLPVDRSDPYSPFIFKRIVVVGPVEMWKTPKNPYTMPLLRIEACGKPVEKVGGFFHRVFIPRKVFHRKK
jgi:hypothetical protein